MASIRVSTRAVETIGRGHLIAKLIREGIGVSTPIWDDGIDLIAHASNGENFSAVPLQLKVSTNTFVGVDHKYKSRAKLKVVFIWINEDDQLERIFVMSYMALCDLFAKHQGTKSWKTGFSYSKTPKDKLKLMEQFELTEKRLLQHLIFEK